MRNLVSCCVFLTVGRIQAMLSVLGSIRGPQIVLCTNVRSSPTFLGVLMIEIDCIWEIGSLWIFFTSGLKARDRKWMKWTLSKDWSVIEMFLVNILNYVYIVGFQLAYMTLWLLKFTTYTVLTEKFFSYYCLFYVFRRSNYWPRGISVALMLSAFWDFYLSKFNFIL
jgi:hypothetical protein